jgi:hypothetical protein
MAQKSQEPKVRSNKRNERKRLLNIIYFVDSNRTRTLTFSIQGAIATVTCLVVVVVWSFFSSALLIREYFVNHELKARSRQLLATIFDYQTRYDQVYERAYPDPSQTNLVETNEDERSKSGEAAVAEKPAEKKERPIGESQTPKVVSPEPLPASGLKIASADAQPLSPKEGLIGQNLSSPGDSVPIAVENFSTVFQEQVLTVRFALKNLDKPRRTSGKVTALAKFVDDQQQTSSIKMRVEPETNDVASESANPTSDQHFNIRYYKNKVFHFDIPKLQTGRVTAVTIAVQDDKGRARDFVFPLNQNPSPSAAQSSEMEPETLSRPYARSVPEP